MYDCMILCENKLNLVFSIDHIQVQALPVSFYYSEFCLFINSFAIILAQIVICFYVQSFS